MPSARSTTVKEFVAFTRFVILLVCLICHHAIHSRSYLVSCTALHLQWGTYRVLQRVADIHFHLCGRTLTEGFWEWVLRIIWSIKQQWNGKTVSGGALYSIVTSLLTHSLHGAESSWEANQFSASQIPCILWNLKVHYRIHKCLPPVPTWASSIQSIPHIPLPEDLS